MLSNIDPRATGPLAALRRRASTVAAFGLTLAWLASTSIAGAETAHSVELLPAPDAQVSGERFFAVYARELGLGPSDALQLRGERASLTKPLRVRFFRQVYRGLPVEGGTFSLTLRDGFVLSGVGRVVTGLSTTTSPRISSADALAAAFRDLARQLRVEPGNLHFLSAPQAELSLVSTDGSFDPESYRLAYRCRLVTKTPSASMSIDVDAESGNVLALHSLLEPAWEPAAASGMSLYNGSVNLSAETDPATGQFRLRAAAIETYDNRASSDPFDFTNAADFTSSSAAFTLAEQAVGVSLQWAMPQALAYFQNNFGGTCLSGALGPIPTLSSYVNLVHNAAFDAGAHVFFWGTTDAGFPLVAIDTVGHELGHCVRNQQVPVPLEPLSGEAAAIHESFSDIFGEMIERQALQAAPDWISGGSYGDYYRDLIHPKLSAIAEPDTYLGVNWQPGPNDSHRHCGVQNRWFTLLALGGAGTNDLGNVFDVSGVGEDTAARIAYQGLTEHVTPDYAGARVGTTQAAIDICGDFSQELISTRNAWYAVGLEPAPFSAFPITEPVDQAPAVDPWPVKLRWQAGATQIEKSWDVEVSDAPDFSTNVHTYLVDQTTVGPNSVPVGMIDAFLEAGKTFYWRVRRAPTATALDCHRPTQSFTTTPKAVAIIAPVASLEIPQKFYPWKLDFSWKPMPGITRYAVQVATDPSFAPSTLLFPERPVDNASHVELDVLVGQDLYWRVRPIFITDDGEDVPGTWTQAFFQTSVPKVELLSPSPNLDVYPWPVMLVWQPVVGASSYVLDMKLGRAQWGDPHGEEKSIPLPADPPTYKINLRADEYNLYYDWRVRVIGPKVPDGIMMPPEGEEGQPGESYFKTGVQTKLPVGGPAETSCWKAPSDLYKLDAGVQTNLTGYEVRLKEVSCFLNQQCTFPRELGPYFQPANGTGHVPINLEVPTSQAALGYDWYVTAIGPEGLRGLETHAFMFLVFTDPPTIVSPAPNGTVAPGASFDIVWQSQMAHGAGFVVDLFKDAGNCSGLPFQSFVVNGTSHGINLYTHASLQNGSSDTDYAVRIHPFSMYYAGYPSGCGIQYSACQHFKVQGAPPVSIPATPDVVDHYYFQGGTGQLLALFSVVTDATSYQLTVREGSPNGPIIPIAPSSTFGVSQLGQERMEVLSVYGLTAQAQSWWFARIGGTQPGTIYYYTVKACNTAGCSPESPWSGWVEGYPAPF